MATDSISIEDLMAILAEACGDLDEAQARDAATSLNAKGLTTRRRLKLVNESCLKDAGLNDFQVLDVLEHLKGSQQRSDQDKENQPPPEAAASSSSDTVGVQEFRLNWKRIYELEVGLKNHLQKGRRLTPAQRIAIVGEVVRQCKAIRGCNRKTFDTVYEKFLLPKHRESFEETLGAHGVEKKTVGGILKQMKDKFDNEKRPRKGGPSIEQQENPNHKATVGCIRWRVLNLPEGESEESLEEKVQELQTIFTTVRSRHWDMEHILHLMEITYKLQRDIINKNMEKVMEEQRHRKSRRQQREEEDEEDEPVSIQDVLKKFPFLFTSKGMELHFKLLTDIDAAKAIDKFITDELDLFLEYFKSMSNPSVLSRLRKMHRALKKEEADQSYQKFLAFMKILPEVFHEDHTKLFTVSMEEVDIEAYDTTDLPLEPHLVAVGTKLESATKFYLCIDKHPLTSVPASIGTLSMIYMAHTIFNLMYNAQCQVTMEFIQRVVFKHEAKKGHRRPATREEGGRFSTAVQHPGVAKFLSKMNDYLESRNADTSSGEELN